MTVCSMVLVIILLKMVIMRLSLPEAGLDLPVVTLYVMMQ